MACVALSVLRPLPGSFAASPDCAFGLRAPAQVFEPPSQSIVATDRILRFGGSCSPDLEWPADTTKTGMDADEVGRMFRFDPLSLPCNQWNSYGFCLLSVSQSHASKICCQEQLEALEQLLHTTLKQLRKSKRGEHGSGFNASSQTAESGRGHSGYSGVSGVSALSSD